MKTRPLNPEIRAPKLAVLETAVDDRAIMAVAIPGIGLSIPPIAGLYGSMSWRAPMLWLGFAFFVALSAAVWFGNRWLLFKQREHHAWFADPMRKLAMLIGGQLAFTVLLTVGALLLWSAASSVFVDTHTIEIVTLVVVLCVIFVTHAYESVFLARERGDSMARFERLERSRVEAELAALTAQMDPHFLFNSLNTLGHLIDQGPGAARRFCDKLAHVYRYVLAARGLQSVSLADELRFLSDNHELLRLRFGASIELRIDHSVHQLAADIGAALPPLSLQTLLENAVKHNRLDADQPLAMQLSADEAAVVFSHAARPRIGGVAGGGLGLRVLDERCRLLAGRGLTITRDSGRFAVLVPLARQ